MAAIPLAQAVRELVDQLFQDGSLAILLAKSDHEKYMLLNAAKAFGALHEILWGEFYRTKIKQSGADADFSTPLEAVTAYREFVIKTLEEAGVVLEQGGY